MIKLQTKKNKKLAKVNTNYDLDLTTGTNQLNAIDYENDDNSLTISFNSVLKGAQLIVTNPTTTPKKRLAACIGTDQSKKAQCLLDLKKEDNQLLVDA